jgi:hypothetical protein
MEGLEGQALGGKLSAPRPEERINLFVHQGGPSWKRVPLGQPLTGTNEWLGLY